MLSFLSKHQNTTVTSNLNDTDEQNTIKIFEDAIVKERFFATMMQQYQHSKYEPISEINRTQSLENFITERFSSFEELQTYSAGRGQDVLGFAILYEFFDNKGDNQTKDQIKAAIDHAEISSVVATLITIPLESRDEKLISLIGESHFIEKLAQLAKEISDTITKLVDETSNKDAIKAKITNAMNAPSDIGMKEIEKIIKTIKGEGEVQNTQTIFEKPLEEKQSIKTKSADPQKPSLWGTFIREDNDESQKTTSILADKNNVDSEKSAKTLEAPTIANDTFHNVVQTNEQPNALSFEKMFPDLSTLDQHIQDEIEKSFDKGNMNDAIIRYADALKERQKEAERKIIEAQNALQNVVNKLDDIDIEAQKLKQQLSRELESVKAKLNSEHKAKSLEIEIMTLTKKIGYYQEHIREIADILDQSPVDLNKLIDQKKSLEEELASLR